MSNPKRLPYPIEDRKAILKVLLDGRARWNRSHKFDEISARTGLDIKEVMAVTGHEPYDIIGTQAGYKHITRASDREVMEAIKYNVGKIAAMSKRIEAFRERLPS